MNNKANQTFRKLLQGPSIIKSMNVHDVLTGIVSQKVGIEVISLAGFGLSASLLGLPDLNFLNITDLTTALRRLTARVSIPVIADADTGHGDLHNVAYTTEEIEAAGASAMLLEDQAFPKRCGHVEGKEVIDTNEMVLKIKSACRARHDKDFVIIARTDARQPLGLDKAIERVNRYCDAGADVAFVEAPQSVEELEIIAKQVQYPKLVNALTFWKTPILSAKEYEQLGYKIVASSIDSILLSAKVMLHLAQSFKENGNALAMANEMAKFDEFKDILGFGDYLSLRKTLQES